MVCGIIIIPTHIHSFKIHASISVPSGSPFLSIYIVTKHSTLTIPMSKTYVIFVVYTPIRDRVVPFTNEDITPGNHATINATPDRPKKYTYLLSHVWIVVKISFLYE